MATKSSSLGWNSRRTICAESFNCENGMTSVLQLWGFVILTSNYAPPVFTIHSYNHLSVGLFHQRRFVSKKVETVVLKSKLTTQQNQDSTSQVRWYLLVSWTFHSIPVSTFCVAEITIAVDYSCRIICVYK